MPLRFATCSISIDRSSCLVSAQLFQLQCMQFEKTCSVSLGGIWTFVSSNFQERPYTVLRPPSSQWNDKFGESQSTTKIRSYQDLSNRLPTWTLHKACTARFLQTDKPLGIYLISRDSWTRCCLAAARGKAGQSVPARMRSGVGVRVRYLLSGKITHSLFLYMARCSLLLIRKASISLDQLLLMLLL